jgi:hypothetical protein
MKRMKNKWMSVVMLIAALSLSSLFAKAQNVTLVQDYLSGLSTADQQTMNSLMNDAQPTAAVTANGLSVFGGANATVLDFNINNFNNVNFNDALLSNVQLIKIRLNSATDFSQVLDLTAASALTQLNCVLLLSSVNATATQLDAVLQNLPTNVSTCYSISIPN